MSEIRANTISNAAGTGPVTLTGQYAAKAWINFNGTGTVAIRQSGNVGSIVDLGTGQYNINFSASMTDSSYCTVGSAEPTFNGTDVDVSIVSSSQVRLNCRQGSDQSLSDPSQIFALTTR